MCGITALINLHESNGSTNALWEANRIIGHRGPDDEGYLLLNDEQKQTVYAGEDTAQVSAGHNNLLQLPVNASWKVGLGHRRLSIIDPTPAGHQPMVHQETGVAITYNGEIYNYRELREELTSKGHQFYTNTDTEVLLHAWVEWGKACLNRLNGMFAFVVLDPGQHAVYAVRDRFGIKPLYQAFIGGQLIFASEIKQIRQLPGYHLELNNPLAAAYLAKGKLAHGNETFDENIFNVSSGSLVEVGLNDPQHNIINEQWYHFKPQPWRESFKEASQRLADLLSESVRGRLQADVPVGSCLSGGLDSSAIVCLIDIILKGQDFKQQQLTVTACFKDQRFDEWDFAKEAIDRVNANYYQTWPEAEGLKRNLEQLVWYLDEPFTSTSQFSQWCVFSKAQEAGLKVMLDGQGSDEMLAGYAGNEISLFSDHMKKGDLNKLIREFKSFKKQKGNWPVGQLRLALQHFLGFRNSMPLPVPNWLQAPGKEIIKDERPFSFHENLKYQVFEGSLPRLLRFEDRLSMAHSIEARVPFLDHRIAEFVLGLPASFIYERGESKVVLRESMKGIIPEKTRNRQDKMGYVTPEQVWLQQEMPDWFRDTIAQAIETKPEFFNKQKTMQMTDRMINGDIPFNNAPWHILNFGVWLQSVQNQQKAYAGN